MSPVKAKKSQAEDAADCEPSLMESPGKQAPLSEEDADGLSNCQEPSISEEEAEQLAKEAERKAALQREKDSLRAPFSELLGGNKKKQAESKLDPSKRVSRITDVNKVIFVDSYILNYSSFFPGKLLGSTLNVGNLSNSEQIVELSIDSNSF